MYIIQILWLLSWPILIIGSFLIVKQVLKAYESKNKDIEN